MDRELRHEMAALIERLHLGLMNSSPEYRLLCKLQAAMAEAHRTAKAPSVTLQAPEAEPEPEPVARHRSLRTSVHAILSTAPEPLPTGELLRRLMGKGITLNARNPRAALSSNLSQDPRFENVTVNGKPMWRIKPAAASFEPAQPPLSRAQKRPSRDRGPR